MESNNIYKTYSVYEQLKGNEQLLLPNMSYIEDTQKVCLHDEPIETEIEDLNYFYIEALEDNLKVAFISGITENVLQYSIDKETWHTLNPTYRNYIEAYSLEDEFEYINYTLSINANEKIWFKGKLTAEYSEPTSISDEVMSTDINYDTSPVGHFYISKPCNVGGNIFSLTYGNDFINKTKFKDIESFKDLFNGEPIVDASNLILPATKLTNDCYNGMFWGCTLLTTAPELPATTLARYCYRYMFQNCTSLISAPELPATTLAGYCYSSMFRNCISLTTAPELSATALTDNCYRYMFMECTSLSDIRINVSGECSGFFYDTFNYCESLSNVYLIGDAYEDVYSVFEGILEKDINVYCTLNTYAASYIPSHYIVNITDANFVEYKSLVLNSATNVNSKDIYTIVEYTVIETYNKNDEIVDIEINNCGVSNQFEENTSSDPIERTVSFTYNNAITAETTITQGAYVDATHKNYLCITALTSGIFRYNNPTNKTLYYSQTPYMYADGSGWEVLDEIELAAGQSIYIKGNGVSNSNVYDNIFYSTCKFNVSGNIMSLLYGDNFEDKIELTTTYTFKYLFSQLHIVDASQLVLPATILMSYCYSYMFNGCTSLTIAPELPATTLAYYCYTHMFDDCTSLVTAPELPATVLADYCYNFMFLNCTSLVNVPELPATTLSKYCYSYMFQGCTSLVNVPELPATTLTEGCYLYMFQNCTSLVNVPSILPANILESRCYAYMFNGCTSLVTAPELPATTLAYECYCGMFRNCTSLVTAPELPATTLANFCYEKMFSKCVALNNVQQVFIDGNDCVNMFDGVCETGIIVLDNTISRKDINEYLCNVCSLPKTWTVDYIDYSQPLECKSLSIIPQKEIIEYYETSVKLNITTNSSYITTNGMQINDITYTYTDISNAFEENTEYNDITRTISYNKYGLSTTAEVTQRAYKEHVKQNYMYITALENCNIYVYGRNNTTVYYSTTNHKYTDGSGWTQLGGSYASLNAGETIYIKGSFANTSSNWGYLYCNRGKINVGGNIMSLIYSDDFEDKYELPNTYAFYKLFDGCKQTLVDASQLVLPATTLTEHCYNQMFYGCTSLINTPELPATTLAPYCYKEMFRGCTSLTCMGGIFAEHYASNSCESMFEECSSLVNAPYIAPIKTLDYMCCLRMFLGCTSLIKAPELPATKLATYCYSSMFYRCTLLTTVPELPATTLASCCYENMFGGCTSLVTAPVLPATTLAQQCYDSMFKDCTSLTTAPELPVTALAPYCYRSMFRGCTSLVTAPELPATTLTNSCYYEMFFNCTSLVTAPELPATILADYCYQYMFSYCTSLVNAPELPATALAKYCYSYMFQGCTSLVNVPELPATTVTDSCYREMFRGCKSLITAQSILPATTLAQYCYYRMFQECTSITTSPKLPATTLANNCYGAMFSGCTNLSNITMLASYFSTSYTSSWVYGVAPTGTFYKHPSMTSLSFGQSYIPSGWTVLYYGEVIECTSLTITSSNVSWRATNAPITYTAIVNINVDGTIYQNMQQTGTITSEEFPQNMDPDNTIERTLSYTYMGITATTTIVQDKYYANKYTINLNNQWRLSTSYSNLDESQYDGIYESFSNFNKDSTNAIMYVNISGYTQFRLYIGSYAESSWDYTIASTLDGTGNYVSTNGFQYKPTSLNNFKEVVYNNIDGGEHTITITYRKDGSQSSYDDRGYLLIPKNQ